MEIKDLRKEDLLEACPTCNGKSGLDATTQCERCNGTGSVLTEAGEAIAAVVHRERVGDVKRTYRRTQERLKSGEL